MKKNKNGFSLIELLLVVSIIALLATISIVSVNSLRVKARDTRRLADIKQLQANLQMYYMDHHFYPAGQLASSTVLADNGFSNNPTGNIYLRPLPTNPTPASDGVCPGNSVYTYTQLNNGSSYSLSFCHSIRGSQTVGPSSNN